MSDVVRREVTWARLSWGLGLGALVVIVIVVAHRARKVSDIVQLLARMRPPWLLAAVGPQLATYACDSTIWRWVLARAGCPQPFVRMFPLSVARLFAGQAVPSGGVAGDVLVVRVLSRHGVPLEASMTALVINLFGFYAALATCAVIAGLVFGEVHAARGPVAAIALPFAVLVAAVPALVSWLVRSGRALGGTWVHRLPLLGTVVEAVGRARTDLVHDGRLLAQSTVLQIATLACEAGTLAVVLAALGQPTVVAHVFAAFMLARAAEVVGPVPGGLGAFEGGCIVGLRAFGVPIATALLATLTLRAFTFWLPMILGGLIASAGVRRSNK
jgi:uncharacterized membrane protein YbhN (UPF0104 family)